jgi:hypothetical protein
MVPFFRTSVIASLLPVVAIAAPLMLSAKPADAAPVDQASCASPSHWSYDARLTAKADQGVKPFVRFVQRTQVIYQVDVTEATQRVERYRQAQAACAVVVASNEVR